MKKLVYQTCESKECYNIEKDEIGLRNLYIVSRRHIFDDETNELICTICNKVTNLNDIKEQDLKELKKLEKAEKKVLKNKSGQTTVTVTTKNIKAIALSGQESGHEVHNNNVIKEQKVMEESVEMNKNIKATKEGKLYIKTEDFFKQEKVINTINQAKNSSIVEEIEVKKGRGRPKKI